MSILQAIQAKKQATHLFGVICGPRLSGKTTLVGTLPGRTLLLQAAKKESGSKSAVKLAAQHGNELDVIDFATLDQLKGFLTELREDTVYQNVVVDSISALTWMVLEAPETQKLFKKNKWDAYAEIKNTMKDILVGPECFKDLIDPDITVQPKNVFFTMSLNVKTDSNGAITDIVPEMAGQATAALITQYCPAVLRVGETVDEQGNVERCIYTQSEYPWPGRVDDLLDSENPGRVEADLSKVLELVQGE